MMSNEQRLVYMVNQIARNFATMREGEAAEATADHITSFWDPRMKAQILSVHESGDGRLTVVAGQAIGMLRAQDKPTGQVPATQFNAVDESGHCDAG